MEGNNSIRVSVRNLVEFILRTGDLDSRFMGSNRAVEGTKAHQKVQKAQGENYTAEVSMKHELDFSGFNFIVEGRADGIIIDNRKVTIDEIKSTTAPLEFIDEEYNSLHWAQAKCYAYIYCVQNSLSLITVRLTYFQLDTEEVKCLEKDFNLIELEDFFYDLLSKYISWATLTKEWNEIKEDSIKQLTFPFGEYRKGQRDLAVAVYKTIAEEKKLFAQAPTGIGKTISTLFPSVKAMGEGKCSKIFYLTAKTITRKAAEEGFEIMKEKGLKFKTVTLTAKDKICFKEESICNPEKCEFAKGHFDRVNEALMDLLKHEHSVTKECVEKYARKYEVCPFELSLDVTLWVDCIICDYNYVFDPRVYLKRFFLDNGGDYTFLVDEAHNLVDRAREMYSSEIYKSSFLELKKSLTDKKQKLYKTVNKLNAYMIDLKKSCEDKKYSILPEEAKEFYNLLRKYLKEAEDWLGENERHEAYDKVLDLYFESNAFIKISELYDKRYVTYVDFEGQDFRIKLFCLDPAFLLSEAMKRGKSSILFSATLSPINYFKEILGGSSEDYIIRLSSPFEKEKLCLLVGHSVSTRYKHREQTYSTVAEYIYNAICNKNGNYMVFFPSYKYMREVHDIFIEEYPEIQILLQESNMNEEQREDFLVRFQPENTNTMLAFAVLGGIFSEGIDLKGERLIGSIIVGVGLPQLCLERNIIQDYFNEKNSFGYEYAYMYPGMNKVQQAAGRVIRSEEDRGIVLLIDDRYKQEGYKNIFPREWQHYVNVKNSREISDKIDEFWNFGII